MSVERLSVPSSPPKFPRSQGNFVKSASIPVPQRARRLPRWSGGVLGLKRPTLPADWCPSQACVDTRDQREERRREEQGGGGRRRNSTCYVLAQESGRRGGKRRPSSLSLVLESSEVKGVKVSGSRTRWIVWRFVAQS